MKRQWYQSGSWKMSGSHCLKKRRRRQAEGTIKKEYEATEGHGHLQEWLVVWHSKSIGRRGEEIRGARKSEGRQEEGAGWGKRTEKSQDEVKDPLEYTKEFKLPSVANGDADIWQICMSERSYWQCGGQI